MVNTFQHTLVKEEIVKLQLHCFKIYNSQNPNRTQFKVYIFNFLKKIPSIANGFPTVSSLQSASIDTS